jgi:hypothetical protein
MKPALGFNFWLAKVEILAVESSRDRFNFNPSNGQGLSVCLLLARPAGQEPNVDADHAPRFHDTLPWDAALDSTGGAEPEVIDFVSVPGDESLSSLVEGRDLFGLDSTLPAECPGAFFARR